MTTTSRVPAVIDALVTICKAASTIGQATPPISVYDGPDLTTAADEQILWIGMDDPDSEQAPIGADSSQQFAGLGTRQRNEEGTIHCVVQCWSGDTTIRTARLQAYAVVASVETLIRTDATIGGTLSTVAGWAEVDGLQLHQNQTDKGAVARVSFHIKYKARI